MTQTTIYILLYVSLFFEVFMLLIFIEKRREIMHGRDIVVPKERLPFVTILMPVFNEQRTVTQAISSLLALDYPQDRYEIIVIDDGSTDGTQRVLSQFTQNPQIRVLRKDNGGKHTALNEGLSHARGDLIGCLDADSYVHPNALSRIVSHFQNPKTMAVIPSIKIHKPDTFVQHIQQAEYLLNIFIRKMLSLIGSTFITPGPFSFFRKEVFARIGPWKGAYNTEDFEICLRMQQHHMDIVNAQDAVVYTTSPRSLSMLYKQRVRWTYGFLLNMKEYRKSFFLNKSQGNLGLFILPLAVFSMFSVLALVGIMMWSILSSLHHTVQTYTATGWHLALPSIDLQWFFLNTSGHLWIGISMIVLMFCMIGIGMKLSEERIQFSRGLLYYGVCYVFLVPLWLTSAIIKVCMSQKPSWR